MRKILIVLAAMLAGAPFALRYGTQGAHGQAIDPTCESSGSPSSYTGATLNSFTPTKSGVVYDDFSATLRLQREAGIFRVAMLGVTDLVALACAADFDNDGWVDFVGAADSPNTWLRFYKNRTYENPEPDWNDATQIRTPKFVYTTSIEPTTSSAASRGSIACGDFNNDGNQDFVYSRCTSGDTCVPSRASLFRGNGNGTFQPPYQFVSSLAALQRQTWGAGNVAVADYNGDGWQDLIWGAGTASSSVSTMTSQGGDVLILLNNRSASTPMFVSSGKLLTNAGFNLRGPVAIAYDDFTGDGVRDLIAAGPSTNRLRLYPGLLGGGVSTTPQSLVYGTGAATEGGGTFVIAADFSLDGRPDFFVGSDNFNWTTINGTSTANHIGGRGFYYRNDGDTQPFSGGYTQQLSEHVDPHSAPNLFDYDMGFAIDYDHDPDRTSDFIAADGNNAGNYYVFANRSQPQYVSCGVVESGVVDIGPLASQEMTVTEVRLEPSQSLNGGTIGWEASNNNGSTWHTATPCADDPSDYCVAFTNAVGNQIRWRASICSNGTRTATPHIWGVNVSYTYVLADNHFRAGPVADDGMIYIGSFRQPGDAGHFYGISDETGATIWDAAIKLQTNGSRNLYTVTSTNVRKSFSTTSSTDPTFQATLLASDATTATTIVNWWKSSRFGLTAPQVMGAVENSTAAVLSPPKEPEWYMDNDTPDSERALIDTYVAAYATRPRLAFVGAKDGALHAFRTNPFSFTDTTNGSEAWAFIPYDVAQRLNANRISGNIDAYPDGAPTLVDAKVGGVWKTVLVMGEGNGGRHVFALDVTNSVTTTGTVNGPTPLWQFSDANMGRTFSKPSVIRVKIAGAERWLAVFASGPGLTTDVGDTVYALDLTTGALVWRFDLSDTNAYIATDITAAETDDEPGTAIDGYIDRLFFADNKGRVWKVDPGSFSGTTMQAVNSTVDVGLSKPALFSTRATSGALGYDVAIAGTVAAGEISTATGKRLVLFFGTGGTEDTPATTQNAFYAVAADDGEIVGSFLGECSGGVCSKFYGGVAVNGNQLIVSQGIDLSGLGLCAPSAGEISILNAQTLAEEFSVPVGSKIVAPVFVQNGELYTVNLQGELVTTQYTGETGTGSGAPGAEPGIGQPENGTTGDVPFDIVSWRQVQ